MKTYNNKYYKWYYLIIDRARNCTIEGYTEQHHIVPRSLGGTDEKCNLVALTAREHLVAHLLLPRFVENKKPMWNAVYMMMNTNGVKVNSRLYEQARIEYWGICKSRKFSPETCAKISAAKKGRPNPKISAAQTGRKMSPETIAKRQATRAANRIAKQAAGIDYPLKGRPNPKISAALKGRKISSETIAKRRATRAANRALKPVQYSSERHHRSYSTVTDLAKLRGLSTSHPLT